MGNDRKSDIRCVAATLLAVRGTRCALRAASTPGSAIIPQIFPDLPHLSRPARRAVDGGRVPVRVHWHPGRRVGARTMPPFCYANNSYNRCIYLDLRVI